MKVVNRVGVKGPSSNCKGCGKITRSHILEPAKYEEYEVITAEEGEEYQNSYQEESGEEEFELRYALLEEPTVMCHLCWRKFQSNQIYNLGSSHEEWVGDTINNIPEIKIFLKRWKYHDFSLDATKRTLGQIKELRKAIKGALLYGE